MRGRSPTTFLALVCLLGSARLLAQEPMIDPCAGTRTHRDLSRCWASEVDHANQEMERAFSALVAASPRSRRGELEKAQKLWVRFRDAHVRALYGDRRHDPDRFVCGLIAQRQLTRARTAQLRRMLREGGDEAVCPL